MFVINFSATPVQVRNALVMVFKLSTAMDDWIALGYALDAILKHRSVATAEDTVELERVAALIASGGIGCEADKATFVVRIDTVTFALANKQFIAVHSEPSYPGQIAIHARLSKHYASYVTTSLIDAGVGFSASPSLHNQQEPEEDLSLKFTLHSEQAQYSEVKK